MPTHAFTIAKLAEAAGIGVEAVRYYQRRGLLEQPGRAHGTSFREYSPSDIQRLHFIKRAQELGFTLDDVAELASLSSEPDKQRIRAVAQRRVQEIGQRVAHLQAMANALEGLVDCCEQSAPAGGCPIVAALAGASQPEPRIQSSPRAETV
ncbi:Mercuric resistance operon regulatory protein [Xylophilus ampelinus]|nr:MerR family DNA-binding protein [Variovorax sp.]VTY39858.1 Mercuric resistance operon regulatory protein [Xylophilus ampelinus]